MDILNFISWIKGGKYSTTIPSNAVTVIGVPTNKRDDSYLPVTVPVSALGSGFTHYVGELFGGGIIVEVYKDSLGVEHGLIASLINLGSLPWTVPAFQSTAIGILAQDFQDGLGNTNAIIAQAGVLNTTYAAGIAKLFVSGSYNDWYLPSNLELNSCYQSALIVNKVLGVTNGFANNYYWSSTETNNLNAWSEYFFNGYQSNGNKGNLYYVRAVRTF